MQKTLQGTEGVVYDPSGVDNSIESDGNVTIIKSGYKHDKEKLENLY